MSTVEEVEASVDLPDDFFDEFEDSKFLDEIVDEIVVPEQTLEEANVNNPKDDGRNDANDEENEEPIEPGLQRCLTKIDKLSKSIERRKQRYQSEIEARKRKRSYSPPAGRYDRNFRSRERRSRSGSRNGRRGGRSRSRERNRSRDRRRRDRSRSESPKNQTRGISFLEELERKFAEKGQDFPEKDLLMKLRASSNGAVPAASQTPMPMGYPDVAICMPQYIQMPPNLQMPMYNQPYPHFWNGNFMMDQHSMPANISMPMQQMAILPAAPNDNAKAGEYSNLYSRHRLNV